MSDLCFVICEYNTKGDFIKPYPISPQVACKRDPEAFFDLAERIAQETKREIKRQSANQLELPLSTE